MKSFIPQMHCCRRLRRKAAVQRQGTIRLTRGSTRTRTTRTRIQDSTQGVLLPLPMGCSLAWNQPWPRCRLLPSQGPLPCRPPLCELLPFCKWNRQGTVPVSASSAPFCTGFTERGVCTAKTARFQLSWDCLKLFPVRSSFPCMSPITLKCCP